MCYNIGTVRETKIPTEITKSVYCVSVEEWSFIMSMNKMTKKDSLSAIRTILVSANAPKHLLDFIDHELELLNAKSAKRRPSKTQKLSAELSDIVVSVLKNAKKPLTIAEIQSVNVDLRMFNGEDITPQRITSILTKLVKEGKVTKEVIKRKTHYSWANTMQDEVSDAEEDCECDDIPDSEDCEFDGIPDFTDSEFYGNPTFED